MRMRIITRDALCFQFSAVFSLYCAEASSSAYCARMRILFEGYARAEADGSLINGERAVVNNFFFS